MAYTIQIDADALEHVAKQLKIPAGTLRMAVQRFNEGSTNLGKPWGDDEIGQQWAEIYVPGLENVQGGFNAIVQGLLKLSADFSQMGVHYKRVEAANSR